MTSYTNLPTAYLIDHDLKGVAEVEILKDVYEGVAFDVRVIACPRRFRDRYVPDGTNGRTLSAGVDLLVFHRDFPVDDNVGGNPAMDEARRRMALKIGMEALGA